MYVHGSFDDIQFQQPVLVDHMQKQKLKNSAVQIVKLSLQ